MAMTINKFVMLVAVPALIITFMADAPIGKFDFDILGAYFLTEFVLYLVAVFIARFIFNGGVFLCERTKSEGKRVFQSNNQFRKP